MVKKLTFQDVEKRFAEQGRTDIVICEEDFKGWKKKSKFFDKVQGEYFWSVPYRVWKEGVVHPKRIAAKRKKTLLEKYGVEHQSQLKEIKEKISKSHLKNFANPEVAKKIKQKRQMGCKAKYGVDNVAKSAHIKEKIAKTNLERYGTKVPSQSEAIKEKIKKTNLQRYGVDNPMKNLEIQERLKKTVQQKYGVKYIGASEVVKTKIAQTLVEKYGTKNSFLANNNKIRIEETGEYISHWLLKQPNPKPSLSTVCRYFSTRDTIYLSDVEKFIANYKEHKTNLELVAEKLFKTKHYNKRVLKEGKYKPDFKLANSVFINVDGFYWHSETHKDKWYHYNLRKEFESSGMRLFQFREDEIYNKPHIVKSIVNNALGKTPFKVVARKCIVNFVKQKEASEFLEQNHLMGSIRAKHIGLFYNDKLVSLLSFKIKGDICKIERFCSKVGTVVVGGFSKLLNALEKKHLPQKITQIHNWVDLRYGTGKHLLNKGFFLARETLGWKWTDYNQAYNRLRCRANMDERKMTQKEHANELGWVKIYDAGQRLFTKKINFYKETP